MSSRSSSQWYTVLFEGSSRRGEQYMAMSSPSALGKPVMVMKNSVSTSTGVSKVNMVGSLYVSEASTSCEAFRVLVASALPGRPSIALVSDTTMSASVLTAVARAKYTLTPDTVILASGAVKCSAKPGMSSQLVPP